MSTLIAERELQLLHEAGEKTGAIRVFAPEPDDRSWRCRYQIEWPSFSCDRRIFGVDSFQALMLALKIIPVEIEVTDDFKAGRLAVFGERITSVSQLNDALGMAPMKGFEQ